MKVTKLPSGDLDLNTGDTRGNSKSLVLTPDDAIQLAHDIYRMARAAKKAQEV